MKNFLTPALILMTCNAFAQDVTKDTTAQRDTAYPFAFELPKDNTATYNNDTLYEYGTRTLDPRIRRYQSIDTIQNNPYTYANDKKEAPQKKQK